MAISGIESVPNPFMPAGYNFPLEKLIAPQMPDTGISSLAEKFRLEQPELSTEALSGAAKLPKPKDNSALVSAGIMGGAQLVGGIGKSLMESAMAEQKAKQEAMAQQAATKQEALSRAGAAQQGALAQLISAYRGSLRG